MDYDLKLPQVRPELDTVGKILDSASIAYQTLYNPSTLELFTSLYQCQDMVKIIHFATFRVNEMMGPNGEQIALTNEDIVEMFRCIRETKFHTNLVLFNSCETKTLVEQLLVDTFDVAIGMEGLVLDDMALEFATEFYTSMAANIPFQEAFEITRKKFIS